MGAPCFKQAVLTIVEMKLTAFNSIVLVEIWAAIFPLHLNIFEGHTSKRRLQIAPLHSDREIIAERTSKILLVAPLDGK